MPSLPLDEKAPDDAWWPDDLGAVFPMAQQGSKAGWPAPACLLGQNQIIACLLPEAGDGKNRSLAESELRV